MIEVIAWLCAAAAFIVAAFTAGRSRGKDEARAAANKSAVAVAKHLAKTDSEADARASEEKRKHAELARDLIEKPTPQSVRDAIEKEIGR